MPDLSFMFSVLHQRELQHQAQLQPHIHRDVLSDRKVCQQHTLLNSCQQPSRQLPTTHPSRQLATPF